VTPIKLPAPIAAGFISFMEQAIRRLHNTMRHALHCVYLGFSLLLVTPHSVQAEPVQNAPAFTLSILKPENESDTFTYEAVNSSNMLPDFVQALNDVISLPRTIEIRIMSCELPSSDISTTLPVTLCYSTIQHTALLDNGLDDAARKSQIMHASLLSVLGTLSPVLMSQLDISSSSEYGKDTPQLAATLALLVGDGLSHDAVEGVARAALDIVDAEENQELPAFWILRGFNRGNTNDMACMIYGSDPQGFADAFLDITSNETVSSERCYGLFSQRTDYWSSLLESHLKR
jgi:hypothetical protein